MTLKFLKTPVLLVTFSIFLPSLGFSAAVVKLEEADTKPSVKMRALIPEMERFEREIEQLKKERTEWISEREGLVRARDTLTKERADLVEESESLTRTIKAYLGFLDFVFAANRNGRDLELVHATYQHRRGGGTVTLEALRAIEERVSFEEEFHALPTDLTPIKPNATLSAGVPAITTSHSVTALAERAGAELEDDVVHSTGFRGMTIGRISPSTIRSNPIEIADLSTNLRKVLLEDPVDGRVARRLVFPAPKAEEKREEKKA